jgi:hypothetical protein
MKEIRVTYRKDTWGRQGTGKEGSSGNLGHPGTAIFLRCSEFLEERGEKSARASL